MKKKLFKPKPKEEIIPELKFNVVKFNYRIRPNNPRRINIFSCFNEFGCETVGVMYCIPKLLRYFPGKYTIVMGWYGREFLYRHLVDEYWELNEEYQWLRDYARAFSNNSASIKRLGEKTKELGKVFSEGAIGSTCVLDRCLNCGKFESYKRSSPNCRVCGSNKIDFGFFSNVTEAKKFARRIPDPSDEKISLAKQYASENCVGIFARGRTTYGRNLSPEFYVMLIDSLKSMGYNVIWLGEKQSTLPCPVGSVVDFSRMSESRDLETTLAIVKQCKFTVQFWTASSRLAGMMGVPYILTESPEQIWGSMGQEGYRRNLCDLGPSKLIVSHYVSSYNNPKKFLSIVESAIHEVENNNFDDVFGLLDDTTAYQMRQKGIQRIGGQ